MSQSTFYYDIPFRPFPLLHNPIENDRNAVLAAYSHTTRNNNTNKSERGMGVSRRLLFFLSDSQTNINRIERMANRPYKKKSTPENQSF